MLATGTVEAAVAPVLLVLGLGRGDVLQAVETEVRVDFVAQAESASGWGLDEINGKGEMTGYWGCRRVIKGD